MTCAVLDRMKDYQTPQSDQLPVPRLDSFIKNHDLILYRIHDFVFGNSYIKTKIWSSTGSVTWFRASSTKNQDLIIYRVRDLAFEDSSTKNQDLILYRVRDLVFENSYTKHQDLIIYRVRDLVCGFINHRQRSDHLPNLRLGVWGFI